MASREGDGCESRCERWREGSGEGICESIGDRSWERKRESRAESWEARVGLALLLALRLRPVWVLCMPELLLCGGSAKLADEERADWGVALRKISRRGGALGRASSVGKLFVGESFVKGKSFACELCGGFFRQLFIGDDRIGQSIVRDGFAGECFTGESFIIAFAASDSLRFVDRFEYTLLADMLMADVAPVSSAVGNLSPTSSVLVAFLSGEPRLGECGSAGITSALRRDSCMPRRLGARGGGVTGGARSGRAVGLVDGDGGVLLLVVPSLLPPIQPYICLAASVWARARERMPDPIAVVWCGGEAPWLRNSAVAPEDSTGDAEGCCVE